jgi:hypothetical protein
MKKTITITVILAVAMAFCLALASPPAAEACDKCPESCCKDCVTKQWAKNNLRNEKKATSIPIWQITQDGTAKSVKWVDYGDNPRFAIYDTNGDSTADPVTWVDDAVLDKETGLVWERSPDTTMRDWYSAKSQCYRSKLANRKGCRLPTVEELASLVDDTQTYPALPLGHPFNVQSGIYWSSTTYASYATIPLPPSAWHVGFSNGGVNVDGKSNGYYVWCVRGGQGHDAYGIDLVN